MTRLANAPLGLRSFLLSLIALAYYFDGYSSGRGIVSDSERFEYLIEYLTDDYTRSITDLAEYEGDDFHELLKLLRQSIDQKLGKIVKRDYESECVDYEPGIKKAHNAGCETDGHYLCAQCVYNVYRKEVM